MWIERDIEPLLRRAARERPSIVITGARQSGKTSLLQHAFPDFHYVSLDVPRNAESAEEAGEQFLQTHPPPLLIDEIQYAPRLLRHLKSHIDAHRKEKGRFVITGSQKFSLMEGVTESLAGRIAVLELHSLSLAEIEKSEGKQTNVKQLVEWMWKGGYPEIYSEDLSVERFYSDYLATYLERDVRQVLQIRNLRDFDRFMRLAASRSAQLLSLNSMASDIGVSPNTVKSWISILEASNIIYLLEPYYENFGKRIVKSPKLYFLDTGLAAFLAGFRSPEELQNSNALGAFFETLALGQIVRWHTNRGQPPNIYFFRDHHGNEVDFLVPRGEHLLLFECKWAETPPKTIKGFEEIVRIAEKDRPISRTILTPTRGSYHLKTASVTVDDCVDLRSLE
jgi:uncharacterized protein